jgi:hypothetical protein
MFTLSNPSVTRGTSFFENFESQWVVWAVELCVTHDSSSLIISKSLGVIWHVESMRHPSQQFIDAF